LFQVQWDERQREGCEATSAQAASSRIAQQSLVDPFPIVRIAIIELLFVSPGWPRNALLPPDVAWPYLA
jgi:hypothetical protein